MVLVAGQMADPMAVFEERRARLADVLVAQLGAEQAVADQTFAALGEATVIDDVLEPRITAPTAQPERAKPVAAASRPTPAPEAAVIPDPALAAAELATAVPANPEIAAASEVPVWQPPVIASNPLAAPTGFDQAGDIQRQSVEVAKLELTVSAPDAAAPGPRPPRCPRAPSPSVA